MANVQKTILGLEGSASQTVGAISGEGIDSADTAPKMAETPTPTDMAEAVLTPEEDAQIAQSIEDNPIEESKTEADEIAEVANIRAIQRHQFQNRQRDTLKARLRRNRR